MQKQIRSLDLSKLHFHSYGVIAEDNPDNDIEVKIFPVEKLYFENGETTVKKGNLDKDELYKPTDLKVIDKVLKVIPEDIELRQLLPEEVLPLKKTKYLYADWCGINNPNRYTAPNVCKGEKVIIYRYSNADRYFWDTLGFELNLRKEDHVMDVYSDKPNIDEDNVKAGKDEDLEDTYYILKSPRDKIIKLHTTDKYGEYTTYDITIKTDDGYAELIDGKGNFIKLDSTTDSLTTHLEGIKAKYDNVIHGDDGYYSLSDGKGNYVKLDSVVSNLTVNINNAVTINSKTLTFNNEVTTFNSSKGFNIATSAYDIKSSSNTIASGSTNYKGGIIKHDGVSIDKLHVHVGNLGIDTSVPSN